MTLNQTNMQRDTITITTPLSKQVVVLLSYITGREKRTIDNSIVTADLQFSVDSQDKKDVKGLKGSMVEYMEDKAISTIVVSIDGQTDDIVNKILNMKAKDYSAVIEVVNNVQADKIGTDIKKN